MSPLYPQPGSIGTKGKLARKPSKTTTHSVYSQVYGTTRLFGNKDLDAPREVPASQEEFLAGLMAELDLDNPDGITVAVGPFSTKGTFAVPIAIAPKVDEFIQGDHPIIHVLANLQGNAIYIRYEIGEKGESQRTKQGAQRALWFDIRLRDTDALAWSIATIKALETSLAEVGIVNPKVRQKTGKHGYKKNEFHVTFSGTDHRGNGALHSFPWWQLRHQLDGSCEGIAFSLPRTPYPTKVWHATAYMLSDEIRSMADVKPFCFHPNQYHCTCALAEAKRREQATYIPKAKRQNKEESINFFKSRAATLSIYKKASQNTSSQASSSTEPLTTEPTLEELTADIGAP
uniref:Uncharacterized protein n=1 Tax=Chrysotila carterae TaxID=13221 RepID=A0A7S4F6L8_CHRCT|mmetsp:Transcript_24138/g.52691  ORF Transcript_24138/g.52691 Transcript_24138/m.52691 type:complete len:345 (+) Transcript_24138:658-1692(+)